VLQILKFIVITIVWGILIAIGFEIGRRGIVKADGYMAKRKVIKEEPEGTF